MTNELSRGKRRVTQADVANKAKVSQALVSYVVNDHQGVSIPSATRERIERAMEELGYVPNITARRLRTKKTLTVAGIIPDITNPFYPAFERGIQDTLDDNGFDLVMYNSDGDRRKEERYVHSMLQGHVDGVIGVFFYLNANDLLPLIEQNIFVVRLEAVAKEAGAYAPRQHLYRQYRGVAAGCGTTLLTRDIVVSACLGSTEGPARFRERGYHEAICASDLQPESALIATGDF